MRYIIGLALTLLPAPAAFTQTQHTKVSIIVVEAGVQADSNAKAKEVDAPGGEKTFTVPLSASGSAPATHYWCRWVQTPGEDLSLRGKLAVHVAQGRAWIYDGNTTTPEQVLAERGLKRVVVPFN